VPELSILKAICAFSLVMKRDDHIAGWDSHRGVTVSADQHTAPAAGLLVVVAELTFNARL